MSDPTVIVENTTTPAAAPTTSSSTTNVALDGQVLHTAGVKPGRKTSEALLGLFAIIVGATLASGVIVNNTAIQIGGIVQMVLASLGYTWSRTMIKTAAPMLLLCFGLAATQPSCAWFTSERKAVASDVVDCTKANAANAIKEFGPTVDALLVYATGGNGSVNADAITDAAKNFGKEVGGCVLADAVARALTPAATGSGAPKASPLTIDPDSLRRSFALAMPGAHFHTAHGDV